jgi:hypothetical protein
VKVEFPPALFTREMAAYYIGGSLSDVDRLRAKGELIAVAHATNSKRVLFRKDELDRYVSTLAEKN